MVPLPASWCEFVSSLPRSKFKMVHVVGQLPFKVPLLVILLTGLNALTSALGTLVAPPPRCEKSESERAVERFSNASLGGELS